MQLNAYSWSMEMCVSMRICISRHEGTFLYINSVVGLK